jgi:hypothetical protein
MAQKLLTTTEAIEKLRQLRKLEKDTGQKLMGVKRKVLQSVTSDQVIEIAEILYRDEQKTAVR